ncbi:MAG TPA: prenyltransferase/squalene oxidase repeat-containing protein [Kofleriaceae bacterium]|nr:prenyltransferase/squalene oxidase repeat-containing protein [Kofleriaceae bacterium]
MRLRQLAASLALVALVMPLGCGGSSTPKKDGISKPEPTTSADPAIVRKTAVQPKDIGETVKKGLAFLAKSQLQSGGWGQGDSVEQIRQGEPSRETANVADTSMALLAFLRSGNTPRTGDHQKTVQRGIEFVLSEIEKSDDDSLYVSGVRNTRVQAKIGPYADTFAALMMLTEAKGTMRDGVANARLDAALKKVVHKVEKNQRENGTWDGQGWAPVLSQALASKGLNRAAAYMPVDKRVLDRAEEQAKSGEMATQGAAGVGLYGQSSTSSTYSDTAVRKQAKVKEMKAKAAGKQKKEAAFQSPDAPSKAEIAAAEAEADAAMAAARDNERQLIARLDDKGFVAGFGNNGGEEFLSYLLISETLVQRGGDEWQRWDNAISKLVGGVQNEDGSWTGHHCITGRTFCTAAALLVLLGDRTPATQVVLAQ